MTLSSDFLATVVTIALCITAIAPVVLALIWIKDWKDEKLW